MQVGDIRTEERKIQRGVIQAVSHQPYLIYLYLEEIIKDCINKEKGISIGGKRAECIRFADDMTVLAESEEEINGLLEDLTESCNEYGMKINVKKTKGMVIGGKGQS